jgi:prepilin-type processing-associated H-X9-DG protein
LPIFLCPSDNPPSDTFTVTNASGTVLTTVAFGNYVGMSGTLEVTTYPDTNNGVLYRNSRIRVTDIIDGASNTLMVGERASRRSPQTTWVGAVTLGVNPPVNPNYDKEGPGTFCLTNTGWPGDGRVPNNPLDHVEDTNSQHSQGVNFLLCDGSVQSLQNTINPVTWAALGTRAGNEAFIGDW